MDKRDLWEKQNAHYGDHDGLFGLCFPKHKTTSPHKNYEQKADPDGICKCSRIIGIFPKD